MGRTKRQMELEKEFYAKHRQTARVSSYYANKANKEKKVKE